MSKMKLLLVDDHAVLRAGLRTLFDAQPDMEVIAEAADGEEAVSKSRETAPDIVLMDIAMPGLGGLKATQQIKSENADTKVLALTMHEDEHYLYQALRAGADGYVPKKAADTELIAAIRATFRGENFIHPSMTAGLISDLRHKSPGSPAFTHVDDGLSERELEVLRLVAQGHTDQEMADILYLSIKTVATYKARLKDKLQLRGRAELVRYAVRRGLLEPES
jgi:two-component system response regulator NreC